MTTKRRTKLLLLGAVVVLALLLYTWWDYSNVKIVNKYHKLMRSSSLKYATRTLDQITQIVVHHSASIGQKAEDYARYHVLRRGWAGIGYHYIIEKDGTIIQGNPLTNISYHVGGENTRSVGICLSGHFSKEQPSAAQLRSLKKLVGYLRRKLPQRLTIHGHREFSKTNCPGDELVQHLKTLQIA